MEVVEQKISIEWCPSVPLERIEAAGRTAWMSEGKARAGSASGFVRSLIVREHESCLEHVVMTMRMVTDIGVARELLRHRLASPTERSTRFCDYSGGIAFIRPVWWDEWTPGEQEAWMRQMNEAEKGYKAMIRLGNPPERARGLLPLSTATEIVLTANLREWRHIFRLRAMGTSGRPHPQVRALMLDGLTQAYEMVGVVFDDIVRECVLFDLLDKEVVRDD
jgi:thymidylate synthase (FAD)